MTRKWLELGKKMMGWLLTLKRFAHIRVVRGCGGKEG